MDSTDVSLFHISVSDCRTFDDPVLFRFSSAACFRLINVALENGTFMVWFGYNL